MCCHEPPPLAEDRYRRFSRASPSRPSAADWGWRIRCNRWYELCRASLCRLSFGRELTSTLTEDRDQGTRTDAVDTQGPLPKPNTCVVYIPIIRRLMSTATTSNDVSQLRVSHWFLPWFFSTFELITYLFYVSCFYSWILSVWSCFCH